jgi:hypothetical protein
MHNSDELVARRRIIDVAVIIPDASPVLTLARIERLDLLASFTVPVRIVDQVYYEITKPENDPKGEVKAALARMHNQIEIVETNVGVGTRPGALATHKSRAAALGKSPSKNTLQHWHTTPGRVLFRWSCSRTPT